MYYGRLRRTGNKECSNWEEETGGYNMFLQ